MTEAEETLSQLDLFPALLFVIFSAFFKWFTWRTASELIRVSAGEKQNFISHLVVPVETMFEMIIRDLESCCLDLFGPLSFPPCACLPKPLRLWRTCAYMWDCVFLHFPPRVTQVLLLVLMNSAQISFLNLQKAQQNGPRVRQAVFQSKFCCLVIKFTLTLLRRCPPAVCSSHSHLTSTSSHQYSAVATGGLQEEEEATSRLFGQWQQV